MKVVMKDTCILNGKKYVKGEEYEVNAPVGKKFIAFKYAEEKKGEAK